MSTTIMLLAGAVLALGMSVFEWRRRDRLAAVLYAAGALVMTALVSLVLMSAVLVCAATTAYHRWGNTARVVTFWGTRSRKKHGVASTLDIVRVASWVAMRRKATTVRPLLGELTRRQRARVPTTDVAVPLCRTGLLRVWASVEDVVCVFGRPRSGKSGWLGHHIIDAPGAVLVTSTRTDLHGLTASLRAGQGPVSVFNPTGLGDLPSTVTFDPLSGCADPMVAYERATDLLAGAGRTGGGDREFWEGQARRVLTALLHAAALGGLGMPAVLRWVANPDTAHREALRLLRRSPSAASYVLDAEQFLTTNDKTRSSITSTIMPCLGWLASPAACAATTGAAPLDVARWLASRGTVYLLGAEESQVAPLVAALTGHIARTARRLAARAPAGRLDPPARLVLDEAALITPVPLHEWTADMGGRGVQIIAAFQSRAQLVARWGETAARVILNNTGATVLFSYGGDTDDLAHWSALAGQRDEPHITHDPHGQVTSRHHPHRPRAVRHPVDESPASAGGGVPPRDAGGGGPGPDGMDPPGRQGPGPAGRRSGPHRGCHRGATHPGRTPRRCADCPHVARAARPVGEASPTPHPDRETGTQPAAHLTRPPAAGTGTRHGHRPMTLNGKDPAGLALGREAERLARRSVAVEERVGELADLLQQLATDVATLAARVGPDGDEAVRAWLLTDDPQLANEDLTDLAEWLGRVYLRYPDAMLPSCWLWHPAAIEELRWLRCTHREAYDEKRGTWQKVADWHDRMRPGVVRRINTAYGACELREHTEDGSQPRSAPVVPLTDAVGLAARAWTSMPDSALIPSDFQVRRAEQHDDAQHRRGA